MKFSKVFFRCREQMVKGFGIYFEVISLKLFITSIKKKDLIKYHQLDGFAVNERDVEGAEADVNAWLEKLGY